MQISALQSQMSPLLDKAFSQGKKSLSIGAGELPFKPSTPVFFCVSYGLSEVSVQANTVLLAQRGNGGLALRVQSSFDLNYRSLGSLSPGATAVVEISAHVPSGSLAASFSSAASVQSATVDPTSGNNTSSVVTTLSALADLEIQIAAAATVYACDLISYTLSVYNHGPSDAHNVLLLNSLPEGVTWVEGCTGSESQVACGVSGALAAGNSSSFNITVVTDPHLKPGTSLEHYAEVSSNVVDPNSANNSAFADTSIANASELVMTMTGPKDSVRGEVIAYTITVGNYGHSVSQVINIADELPEGLILIDASATRTGAGELAGNGVTCQVDRLAVGETVTMYMTAMVDPLFKGTQITNYASLITDSWMGVQESNQVSYTMPVYYKIFAPMMPLEGIVGLVE